MLLKRLQTSGCDISSARVEASPILRLVVRSDRRILLVSPVYSDEFTAFSTE